MEGKIDIPNRKEVQPIVKCPRRLQFSVSKKLKENLSRLENLGIIKKISRPIYWINSMAIVEKSDGSVRLCPYPRLLNEAVVSPHYPVPTFDDITARLHGNKIFTKLTPNPAIGCPVM